MKKSAFRIAKKVYYLVVICFLILLVTQSNVSITAVQGALLLCYRTVIPTLFPFFILSSMLVYSGFGDSMAKLFSPVMRPIFQVSGTGSLPFVLGLVCGYPAGAKCVTTLYQSGALTKDEAERLLPFCNNSGPLFVIGAVGSVMMGNVSVGIYLYVVHVISAACVGVLQRASRQANKKTEQIYHREKKYQGYLQAFSNAVSDSVLTILTVCGFIIFFAAIIGSVSPFCDRLFLPPISLFIKSVAEITNGIYLTSCAGYTQRITLSFISFLLGFGGLCVCMQVSAVVAETDISLKRYVVGKIVHGVISAMIVYVSFPFLTEAVRPVFASPEGADVLLLRCPPFLSMVPVVLLFVYFALKLKYFRKNNR